MKKIGLYFGTFNPIHVGHLIIANYMSYHTDLDEVWLIVSPQNPLKEKTSMLADYHRLSLVRVAIEDNPKLKVSNIEFDLPKPSYTINTLTYLKEKYPNNLFCLIMGEDNLRTFHKWKNYEMILKDHFLYVYPRIITEKEKILELNADYKNNLNENNKVKFHDAPVMKISSSFIRKAIKEKKDVTYMLTDSVAQYVKDMHFYEK